MTRIKQIIDEIAQLKNESTHRSALRIFSLMENNKKLFLEFMDVSDFNYLLSGFEKLSEKKPNDLSSPAGHEEYQRFCANLLFHCSRLV